MSEAVRRRFVESLARRAAAHQGAARRVLDERLAQLSQTAHAAPAPVDPSTTAATDASPPRRGALAELVEHVARHKPVASGDAPRQAAAPSQSTQLTQSTPPTPPTLQFFRRTWSRLSAEQRLAQSRDALPDNAGPLNSQRLVHRALTHMQTLSPAYLERFVTHIEALLWLERNPALPPRDAGARKGDKGEGGDKAGRRK